MHTKKDLENLAQIRLTDAQLLLKAGSVSSAYYLAGYAVELSLKAYISKQIRSDVIPDKVLIDSIYNHDLKKLLGVAGLRQEFEADRKSNKELDTNWGTVAKWNSQSRYQIWDVFEASALVEAVGDPINGIFVWVKKYW